LNDGIYDLGITIDEFIAIRRANRKLKIKNQK